MLKKLRKYILCIVGLLLLALLGGIAVFYFHGLHYSNSEVRKNDMEEVTKRAYEVVLLTMYSGETFSTYPFEYFQGTPTYKAGHTFENLSDISDYIDYSLAENETISELFILLEPGSINADFFYSSTIAQAAYRKLLRERIVSRQDVEFVFLLPSYSLDFWSSMADDEVDEYVDSFILFCNEFAALENVKIYYFGDLEWLTGNPSNYIDGKSCTEEVYKTLTALTMSDEDYLVTESTVTARFEALREMIKGEKAAPRPKYDLSDYTFVFFGDSIIGNYFGSLSVTGIIASLTGTDVYNCAIGGQAASAVPGDEEVSFNGTLGYFLKEKDAAYPEGKEQYISEVERFHETNHSGKKVCFVLEYGLNDYFDGRAVYNPADESDIYTYSGALITGITRIRAAYPEADIILLTPTFTQMFENGMGIQSEKGGNMIDYVEAVKKIAQELEFPLVDNYFGLGVNETNGSQYIADGTHYNESGRYKIARYFIDFVADYYDCN